MGRDIATSCKSARVRPLDKYGSVKDYVELDISVVTVEDDQPASLGIGMTEDVASANAVIPPELQILVNHELSRNHLCYQSR